MFYRAVFIHFLHAQDLCTVLQYTVCGHYVKMQLSNIIPLIVARVLLIQCFVAHSRTS